MWLDKLYKHKNGIALIFARCETKWAQKHFKICNAVFFLQGRINFIPSDLRNTKNTAANGNMFLIYGKRNIKKVINSKLKGKLFINDL